MCNTSHTIMSTQHSIQSFHFTSETLSDFDSMEGARMRLAERPIRHGGVRDCRHAMEDSLERERDSTKSASFVIYWGLNDQRWHLVSRKENLSHFDGIWPNYFSLCWYATQVCSEVKALLLIVRSGDKQWDVFRKYIWVMICHLTNTIIGKIFLAVANLTKYNSAEWSPPLRYIHIFPAFNW